MSVPEWLTGSIFYHIFPDRFYNGDPSNDPSNQQPWGAKPTTWGFQGGDLRGVINRLDYLEDLGINAIYLNPIFRATSNHRYNTTDYFEIDPKLGSFKDFEDLIETAHSRGFKVILDGVFNHTGRGFFAFQDLLENEDHSDYVDWYHVQRFPLHAYGPGKAQNYTGWWSFKSLPKLNTDTPEVRKYLMQVARYWIERGVDGWRLDVPNEIDDDDFWTEFREVVKSANPQAYLVGEIWEVDPRWVGDRHFDGVINYPFREALIDFLIEGHLRASDFAAQLEKLMLTYPQENAFAHLLPLGSHDTARVKTIAKGDMKQVRLMTYLQFFFPGLPIVYYGDEIGLEGGEDPDCRQAFLWEKDAWDEGYHSFIQSLISLRKRTRPLTEGNFERVFEDDDRGIVVFSRLFQGSQALLAMNTSSRISDIQLRSPKLLPRVNFADPLDSMPIRRSEDALEFELPAMSAAIFVGREGS